jgi:hypothetical protein
VQHAIRDLERLETTVETIGPGETGHDEVADRLRRILRKLDAGAGTAGDAEGSPPDSADPAELLAFIDSRFGDLHDR